MNAQNRELYKEKKIQKKYLFESRIQFDIHGGLFVVVFFYFYFGLGYTSCVFMDSSGLKWMLFSYKISMEVEYSILDNIFRIKLNIYL